MKGINFISFIAKKIYNKEHSLLAQRITTTKMQVNASQYFFNEDLLIKFLISGEDHRFRYHVGFDFIAIIRAIKNRIVHNKFEGASTIEQQLVRVLTNDYEKTFRRKIKEIFLATTLCELIPRNDIPFIYLNVAYYGANANNLEKIFAQLRLQKVECITEEIAAEIVAKIKYPEPQVHNEKRMKQIAVRKEQLLSLYKKHNSRKLIKVYG